MKNLNWMLTTNLRASRCCPRLREGFTLIELLVVIGVIGILAGLLMPALSKAREASRAIACTSHFKEIGVGTILYAEDYGYYPPGRQAGITQWDLCVGVYAGGKQDMTTPEARTALFMCPSAKIKNKGTVLNYSANPNVLKEVTATVGPTRPDDIRRPSDVIVVADSIQYSPDGSSHALLWGVLGSIGRAVYWNDGLPQLGEQPIRVGADKDEEYDTMSPLGADFRYRHSDKQANALFVDGHVSRKNKGKVKDKNLYTNY